MNAVNYLVTFTPADRSVPSQQGETLLDCARRAGVRLSGICGGRGLCKSCVIRITRGVAAAPSAGDRAYFTQQELDDNWRRACQTFLTGDCTVEIPARATAIPLRTQIEAEDIWVQPDPVVRSFRVVVPEASLQAPVGDDIRLKEQLNGKWPGSAHHIDHHVQQGLSAGIRERGGRVDAISRFGEVIGLIESRKGPLPGLAVDIGTTNIGALLVDLRNGRTLRSMGMENPQVVHGADVITRLAFARRSPEARYELHRVVIDAINAMAGELCAKRGLNPGLIADVVIVGNTAMHHLFLNLPIQQLAQVPFVPAIAAATDVKARDLGLDVMPGAYVHLLPNIAGFVGADHTAVLLALGGSEEQRTVMALDIGTNTEISLIHKGKLSSLSCPSGPALEGGHIRCGMRSAPGAIEAVRILGNEVQLQTINDAEPIGICGSGVIDICAQLYLAGVTNASGRMNREHPRVRQVPGKRELEFVLVDNQIPGGGVVFTQSDVRAVQLAKGAIQAGIRILLEQAGIEEEDLEQVIIAGAFGNYIDVNSSIVIGMLPDLPPERYAQIGNAAGIGAKLALISHAHRTEAQAIANNSRYVELSGSSHFNHTFMRSMAYPRIDTTQPEEVLM